MSDRIQAPGTSPPEPVNRVIAIDLAGQPDFRAASGFLRSLFNGQERGVLALFCKPSNVSHFAHLDRPGWHLDAAFTAMQLRDHCNVYVAVGVQGTRPERGRGKEVGVISLPALWADIDTAGPNHVALALPPTIDDAMSIATAVPFKPTVIVYTGGGIQAYWLFKEPWELDSDKERKKAKALSKAFQKYLQNRALDRGWVMDGTADLCRLLRLPGTYNRKQAEPVLVRYEVIEGGRRYNPSDFEDFLDLEADPELKAHVQGPAPEQPTAEFLRVLAGCSWIRHCKDDAVSLPEPEWYRMLSIVGRCKDGVHLAHELSLPYPKYSETETAEKLKQAMGAAGPATCKFIGGDLGCANYCAECNHRDKIASPVVLGIPKRAKRGKGETSDGGHPRRSGLPNIQANDRQLRDVTRESMAALRAFNTPPSIFVRAGKPVCIYKEENGRHIITEATDRILRNRLTRAADYYEITMDGATNCPPPMDMVKDILAMPPMEWELPALQGVIEAPALREDGTIITVPGYDEQSRLFYAQQDGLDIPEIPDHPTADHIDVAVEMVHDTIADFPFVDAASRTNAIAAMLTAVVRPAIKGPTPLALFDATTAGTGKSLLSEVVSLTTSGREAAMFSAPRDSEEWRKALTSVLREGSAVVVIDNVNYRLDSGDFCKALTETTHGDRVLGKSQTINLPVRCAWIATGNNIQLGGDMPRRCYWSRMDAGCSKPFQRTGFRHKRLKEYVLKHRGELLAALLTLARAWFVAGRREPDLTPVGSFEDWSVIIGGILQHAGIEGFLANSNQLYDQADIESVQWEAFLKTLDTVFYGEPFTVSQVWERMSERTWNETNRQTRVTDRAEGLRAALPDLIAKAMDREGFFKQRLGFAFSEHLGRRYGDSQARIERDAKDLHDKVARWKVVRNG
jgi:hypothetical protein